MTAKDAISPIRLTAPLRESQLPLTPVVAADEPLTDVLPKLLEAPERELSVVGEHGVVGVIDSSSLLEAFARMIPSRDDCSIITVECRPADYSASAIARAVEDADAHLVDLWSSPGPDDSIRVTLRVRLDNPDAAVRSLRRYGYEVAEVAVHHPDALPTLSEERLSALQVFLNV